MMDTLFQRERFPILTHIVFRLGGRFRCIWMSESNPGCPAPLCIDKLFSYPLKPGTLTQLEPASNMDALSTWGAAVKELRRTNHHLHLSFEKNIWNKNKINHWSNCDHYILRWRWCLYLPRVGSDVGPGRMDEEKCFLTLTVHPEY